MSIAIKGWHKFQHFKDRKPPWIKLYRDLLDDVEWFDLDPAAAKVLVMLWLIASEEEGFLPSTKSLAFRLRIDEPSILQILTRLNHWLIFDDINVISERYQLDAPETERETERETEKVIEKSLSLRSKKFIPPSIDEVSAYCKERNNGVDANAWINHYQSKGWLVGKSKMVDWQAAVRTWEKKAQPELIPAKRGF